MIIKIIYKIVKLNNGHKALTTIKMDIRLFHVIFIALCLFSHFILQKP